MKLLLERNRREDLFSRASRGSRGSRGDGGRGGGAGARAKRASGDGCVRVRETSRASPRGRARGDARARASRPPRASPGKNRGTETRVAPNDVGTVGDRVALPRALPRVVRGAPAGRARDVEDVPSCAWVATADPHRRSRPCRSSRGRGRIETRVAKSRMRETAFESSPRSFFILFPSGSRKSGRGRARRASNPRTRDSRRASGTRVGC